MPELKPRSIEDLSKSLIWETSPKQIKHHRCKTERQRTFRKKAEKRAKNSVSFSRFAELTSKESHAHRGRSTGSRTARDIVP